MIDIGIKYIFSSCKKLENVWFFAHLQAVCKKCKYGNKISSKNQYKYQKAQNFMLILYLLIATLKNVPKSSYRPAKNYEKFKHFFP
jgi:hypothetical protein